MNNLLNTKNKKVKLAVAKNLNQKVISLKRNLNLNFLKLAKVLKTIRDGKLYKALGFLSFEAYIASPEIDFAKPSVYRFIKIYETFIEELKVSHERLSNLDYNKLSLLLPIVNERNKAGLLEDADKLNRSELGRKVEIIKHGPLDAFDKVTKVFKKEIGNGEYKYTKPVKTGIHKDKPYLEDNNLNRCVIDVESRKEKALIKKLYHLTNN